MSVLRPTVWRAFISRQHAVCFCPPPTHVKFGANATTTSPLSRAVAGSCLAYGNATIDTAISLLLDSIELSFGKSGNATDIISVNNISIS